MTPKFLILALANRTNDARVAGTERREDSAPAWDVSGRQQTAPKRRKVVFRAVRSACDECCFCWSERRYLLGEQVPRGDSRG